MINSGTVCLKGRPNNHSITVATIWLFHLMKFLSLPDDRGQSDYRILADSLKEIFHISFPRSRVVLRGMRRGNTGGNSWRKWDLAGRLSRHSLRSAVPGVAFRKQKKDAGETHGKAVGDSLRIRRLFACSWGAPLQGHRDAQQGKTINANSYFTSIMQRGLRQKPGTEKPSKRL